MNKFHLSLSLSLTYYIRWQGETQLVLETTLGVPPGYEG